MIDRNDDHILVFEQDLVVTTHNKGKSTQISESLDFWYDNQPLFCVT